MPRIALDLNTAAGREHVKGQWRFGAGLVPGEPNEGLTAQLKACPPRLADFDDSPHRLRRAGARRERRRGAPRRRQRGRGRDTGPPGYAAGRRGAEPRRSR
jgi:hypothetical protein